MRYAAAATIIVTVFALGGLGGYVLHGQDQIRAFGAGFNSCGTWLTYRRADDPTDSFIQSQWVNGYLTGAQDQGEESLNESDVDVEGRNGWIDNYCEANPLDNLVLAARALYFELLSL